MLYRHQQGLQCLWEFVRLLVNNCESAIILSGAEISASKPYCLACVLLWLMP